MYSVKKSDKPVCLSDSDTKCDWEQHGHEKNRNGDRQAFTKERTNEWKPLKERRYCDEDLLWLIAASTLAVIVLLKCFFAADLFQQAAKFLLSSPAAELNGWSTTTIGGLSMALRGMALLTKAIGLIGAGMLVMAGWGHRR